MNCEDVARQRGDGLHALACGPRNVSEGVTVAGALGQRREQEGFQRTVDWHVANRAWLKDIKL